MRTISFGSVEGRFVFMDEATDTYFTIESELQADIEAAEATGDFTRSTVRLRSALEVGDQPVRLVRANWTLPTCSLLDELGPARAPFVDIVKAAYILCSTRSQLLSGPIEALLCDIFKGVDRRGERSLAIDKTLKFLAARKFVPLQPNCLLDSLSLARFIGGGGNGVSMVFGVKLDPFAAHCWLQSGKLALNDRTENVAVFTVVRVIGCSDLTL